MFQALSRLLFASLLLGACRPCEPAQEVIIAELDDEFTPLLHALESYREKKGEYPLRLVELVPEYADKDPQTTNIGSLITNYSSPDGVHFSMLVKYPDRCSLFYCAFTSGNRSWNCIPSRGEKPPR